MSGAPSTPEFPLSRALEFLSRLWQLNHALEALSRRMESQLGVTAQQRLVIRCIGSFPGMNAGQLATVLHVDPGTISVSLRGLEAKGLVQRRRDPEDGRRIMLGLTARGRALDAPTQGTVEGAVEELLVDSTDRDTQAAMAVLERLSRLLDQKARG